VDGNENELSNELLLLIWMIIALFLDLIVSLIIKALFPALELGSIFVGGLFGLGVLLAIGIYFRRREL